MSDTTYKIQNHTDIDGNGYAAAVLKDDKWSIPFAEGNTDYQEYLAWIAEGNTAEPADE